MTQKQNTFFIFLLCFQFMTIQNSFSKEYRDSENHPFSEKNRISQNNTSKNNISKNSTSENNSAFHPEKMSKLLYQAWQQHQPKPHLSIHYPKASLSQAYATQFHFVRKRLETDHIAGFKAGLTSSASQKKFHVNHAVSGVLFKSGLQSEIKPIYLHKHQQLMIETELGFKLSQNIKQPLSSIEALKSYIQSVMPILELPDLGFASTSLTTQDIIAANVASHYYLISKKEFPVNNHDINSLSIQLKHNGHLLHQANSNEAMGNQWQALLWLVNHLIKEGYILKKNQILITGALGKMWPLKEGKYHADFSDFGKMTLIVKP